MRSPFATYRPWTRFFRFTRNVSKYTPVGCGGFVILPCANAVKKSQLS